MGVVVVFEIFVYQQTTPLNKKLLTPREFAHSSGCRRLGLAVVEQKSSLRRRIRNAHAKLVPRTYLITMLFTGLTATEITHPIALGNFNNEIFQLMNHLASAMVGVFLGGESAKNTGGVGHFS